MASPEILDKTLDCFYNKISALKQKYERAPTKFNGNIWWTDELAQERSTVRTLRRRYQKCRDPLLRNDLRFIDYKSLARYRCRIEQAKEIAIRRNCTMASRKNIFGLPFTTAFQKCSSRSALPALLTSNDDLTTNTLESAGLLLERLLAVDLTENDTLAQRALRIFVSRNTYATPSRDDDFTITELQKAIRDLNPNAAAGLDCITTYMTQLLFLFASPFLLLIFNGALHLGHFPPHWKKARVAFLLKPGRPPREPKSYRTICISSIFGKVLERMLNARLYFFMHRAQLLHPNQYGFTQGQSSTSALYALRLQLQQCRDEGSLALILSLDFEGAFDSIWHPALLYFFRTHNCPSNI